MSERVVLLAVDGLDWTVLRAGAEAGRLPNLRGLLEDGAHAEVAVQSCVPGLSATDSGFSSPTLWTTVATGQHYFQHGVYDFCNALENAEQPPLFESRHVRSARLWDVLAHHGMPSLVVGYYVTYPAYPINGIMVSDMFGEVDGEQVVSPASRRDDLARLLEAHDYPEYVRTFGVIGSDAGARQDSPRRLSDARLHDTFVGILRRFTQLTEDEIRFLMESPEAERVRRLIGYRLIYPFVRDQRFHRVFLSLLDAEPWRLAVVYYRLIDFACHGFWTTGHELPPDFVRRYGDVIEHAYAWIDACVGEIRRQLRPDDRLIVLSDHGFRANESAPDLATCHDVSEFSYGEHAEPAVLLVGGGPRTGSIQDVTLLDIAPTVLDFLGIPQSEGLDGGPVPGLLSSDSPRDLPKVDAYPYVPPAAEGGLSDEEQEVVTRRLAALGYIE